MLARARLPYKKTVPESAMLRQVGERPMVAPTHSTNQECAFCYILWSANRGSSCHGTTCPAARVAFISMMRWLLLPRNRRLMSC